MVNALIPFFKHTGKTKLALSSIQKKSRTLILEKLKKNIYKTTSVGCALCDAKEYKTLLTTDKFGIPTKIVKCKKCFFIYTETRFDDQSLISIYKDEYRQLEKTFEDTSAEKLFFQEIEKGENIYKLVEKFLPKRKGLIVEIGCGAAGALLPFKSNGYDVIGFDFNKEYLNYGASRGITVFSDDFFEFLKKENSCIDLIILEQTLEHIFDVSDFLEKIRSLMDDKSILYVGVPGVRNIHDGYNGNVLEYFAFFHLYHFDENTLLNLLRKNGFQSMVSNEKICAVFKKGNYGSAILGPDDIDCYLIREHRKWRFQYFYRKTKRAFFKIKRLFLEGVK